MSPSKRFLLYLNFLSTVRPQPIVTRRTPEVEKNENYVKIVFDQFSMRKGGLLDIMYTFYVYVYAPAPEHSAELFMYLQ